MKYIVTATPDGMEEIYLFPSHVKHSDFTALITNPSKQAIAAGFVTSDQVSRGDSYSLGLKSREQDTELLKVTYWT